MVLSFRLFLFDQCIVCPSSNYGLHSIFKYFVIPIKKILFLCLMGWTCIWDIHRTRIKFRKTVSNYYFLHVWIFCFILAKRKTNPRNPYTEERKITRIQFKLKMNKTDLQKIKMKFKNRINVKTVIVILVTHVSLYCGITTSHDHYDGVIFCWFFIWPGQL